MSWIICVCIVCWVVWLIFVVFFKQKTAYEMRISDWSSDVCSSDLGDRRARVSAGGLLLDRDRGRQPFDMIDIGLLHQFEELARIGRERLDIAALPIGIDGVDREARFARARQAGDPRERVAGDEIGRASCRERVGRYV